MAVFGSNEELINRIKEGMETCKNAKQGLSSYEKLLDDARELYERILLIRYKAMELHQKSNEVKNVEEPILEPEVAEQAKQEIAFSLFGEIESTSNPSVIMSDETETTPSVEVVQDQEISSAENASTLVEKLEDEPNDFVSTMQKSSISSINEGLDLNSRIRLVKHLFDGDSSAFASTIEELDNQPSKSAATACIAQLKTHYVWNEDIEEYQLLSELVERRFRS